eukprot:scaffold20250_cov20-Tisochrysis_lutea.AAC.1
MPACWCCCCWVDIHFDAPGPLDVSDSHTATGDDEGCVPLKTPPAPVLVNTYTGGAVLPPLLELLAGVLLKAAAAPAGEVCFMEKGPEAAVLPLLAKLLELLLRANVADALWAPAFKTSGRCADVCVCVRACVCVCVCVWACVCARFHYAALR